MILVANLALLAAVMLIKPRPVTVSALGRSAAKPNVLFIAVDDLNHWVRHLGRNKQVIRLASRFLNEALGAVAGQFPGFEV